MILDPGKIIFLLIVYFALMIWIAKEFQYVSQKKGYTSNRYFWICLIIPLAGWILVAALPEQTKKGKQDLQEE